MSNKLNRGLGFVGLLSTGVCSMLGASIYLVPFMIHRNVPGIGPYVLPAFMIAALPALFAAMAYAALSSAMPRAGGAYIYASRGLHPYLGFIASFAQWFGLSIAIGVIGYVIIPFVRDVFVALDMETVAKTLEIGWVRVGLGLALLWSFIFVNLRGLTFYQKIVVPMMVIMFVLGGIVIIMGFYFGHEDFVKSLPVAPDLLDQGSFDWSTLLSGSAILMSSFIGFDAIAQAGGEVKNPVKWLPRAIMLCIVTVACFYFLFTAAVYHTVPWQVVAEQAQTTDITAPGFFNDLIPPYLTVLIVAGAAIALINDLPAMFLSVSRLVYAWAADGVFPKTFAKVNPKTNVPANALILSGGMATVGLLGSHFAGDFFLGVDIMVTSMLVNFALMCLTLILIYRLNPDIAQKIQLFRAKGIRLLFAGIGIILLFGFLGIHIGKDLNNEYEAWYFHSTPIWIIVMLLGTGVFFWHLNKIKNDNENWKEQFRKLPKE